MKAKEEERYFDWQLRATVHGKTATEVVPLHPVSSFSPLLILQDFEDGFSHSMNVINIISPYVGLKDLSLDSLGSLSLR